MAVFVHIGLIKTGSTFLQKYVFPQLVDSFSYVGPTARFPDPSLFPIRQSVLISNENLGGNPIAPHKHQVPLFEQFKTCIDAICNTFHRPRIIVGFREPASFIQSVYKQHLHERGVFTWEGFLDQYSTQLVDDVFFQKYIEYAQGRLEPHELFLFQQSELWERREAMIDDLLGFLGAQSNGMPALKLDHVANSSVPLRYENTLRRLNMINQRFNKVTGKNLGVRVGGAVFNPTYLCRSVLPRWFGKGRAERDLSAMKRVFADDWAGALNMISLSRETHAATTQDQQHCS